MNNGTKEYIKNILINTVEHRLYVSRLYVFIGYTFFFKDSNSG